MNNICVRCRGLNSIAFNKNGIIEIKVVIIMLLVFALFWACSTTPKTPTPPPPKVEIEGKFSFEGFAGQLIYVIETEHEKFAVFTMNDCKLDLPSADIQLTPSGVSWTLRSNMRYKVIGYVGGAFTIPKVGAVKRLDATYIGQVKKPETVK